MKHLMQHQLPILLATCFICSSVSAHPIPGQDSEKYSKECTEDESHSLREEMQNQLKIYNDARFAMSGVLRAMANDYALNGYVKKRVLGFAEHFDEMRENVPNLNPGSPEFKNFDFRLGMSFASASIFLNSTPEISRHFQADQKNPKSNLSQFVVKLDQEGDAYFALLNKFQEKEVIDCSTIMN